MNERLARPQRPTPPMPGAVLVIQRWNHWVRIYDPETDEFAWVDLSEREFERVSDPCVTD